MLLLLPDEREPDAKSQSDCAPDGDKNLSSYVFQDFTESLDLAHVPHRRGLLEEKPLWRGVLDLAADKAGWGNSGDGRFQGISLMEGYNTYMSQVAEIPIVDGKVA